MPFPELKPGQQDLAKVLARLEAVERRLNALRLLKLDDLADVRAAGTVVDGDVLEWIAADQLWEPAAGGTNIATELSHLTMEGSPHTVTGGAPAHTDYDWRDTVKDQVGTDISLNADFVHIDINADGIYAVTWFIGLQSSAMNDGDITFITADVIATPYIAFAGFAGNVAGATATNPVLWGDTLTGIYGLSAGDQIFARFFSGQFPIDGASGSIHVQRLFGTSPQGAFI